MKLNALQASKVLGTEGGSMGRWLRNPHVRALGFRFVALRV